MIKHIKGDILNSNTDMIVHQVNCQGVMGSGSTGVACINTNRNFIGIELDENYFNITKERIEQAEKNSVLRGEITNEIHG